MKRNLWKLLVVLCVAIASSVLFVACKKTDNKPVNDPLKVTINWNFAGSENTTIEVGSDGRVNLTSITVPENPGFRFEGFYTDAACTKDFDAANYTVTFDFTIYAKWAPESSTDAPTLTRVEANYVGGVKTVGDSLSASDISIVVYYSDGSTKTVTDFTIGDFDASTPGEKDILIRFVVNGKARTAFVSFQVNAKPIDQGNENQGNENQGNQGEGNQGEGNQGGDNQGGEQTTERAVLVVDGVETDMVKAEGTPTVQFVLTDVALGNYAYVRVLYNGSAVPYAEGSAPSRNEVYDFRLDVAENLAYATKHQTPPTADRAILKIGEREVAMTKDAALNQYSVTNVSIEANDTADVYFNDTKIAFREGYRLNGAGIYDFFYNADENTAYLVKQPDKIVLKVGASESNFVKDEESPIEQYKIAGVDLAENAEVSASFNGKNVPFASADWFQGAGKYDFYLNARENLVYAVKQQVGDKAVLKIGNDETQMIKDDESQADQYKALDLEIGVSDEVAVYFNNAAVPFADQNWKSGAGVYDFYLKVDENLVYVNKHVENLTYTLTANGVPHAMVFDSDKNEYSVSVELREDEVVTIKDSRNNSYSNFENGFTGTATKDGEYVFYLKMTEGNPIWVHYVEYVEVYVENTFGYETLYVHYWKDGVITSGWPGIQMDHDQKEGWWKARVDTRADHINFTDGVAENTQSTAESELDFNNLYFYGGAWHDFYPLEYFLKVNGANPQSMEEVNGEYKIQVALEKDDAVTIVDNKGDSYCNWQTGCNFKGTSPSTAEYIFYLKPNESNLIWVHKIEYADLYVENTFGFDNLYIHYWNNDDGFTTAYPGEAMTPVDGRDGWFTKQVDTRIRALLFTNGAAENTQSTQEIAVGNLNALYYYGGAWHDDYPLVYTLRVNTVEVGNLSFVNGEYTIQVDLAKNDDVSISDNKGVNYCNWEVGCEFNGIAATDGTYSFYLKTAENNQIWVDIVTYTTIYVENSFQFEDVYAVYRNDGGALTTDSGVKMTAVEGKTGWVSAKISDRATFIKFTNGGANETAEFAVDLTKPYFYDKSWNASYPTDETHEIYFYNTNNWDPVKAFAWRGSNDTAVGYLGNFPGSVMTGVDGHDGWYKVSVSSRALKILFTNGLEGALERKTADLDLDFTKPYFKDGEWTADYPAVEQKITIYYYNSNAWDTVNAYAWKEGTPDEEKLGVWPGTQMSAVQGKGGWFKVEVGEYADRIVFSNGANSEQKTGDLTINPSKLYFKGGEWTTAFDPEPEQMITIYYFNTNNWNPMIAFAWSGSDQDPFEKLGTWPGTVMTPVYEHPGWFSVEVGENAEKILFTNGMEGEQNKTANLTIDPAKLYYKDGTWTATYPVPEENITIYFYNESAWANVYAYGWSGTEPNDVKKLGDFPGRQMTAVEGKVGWFKIDVAESVEKIIFNDGVGGEGRQTEDLTIDPAKLYYKAGEWTATYPADPTPEETRTIYFYNASAWASVYAYAWSGTEPNAVKKLGDFPGEQMTAVQGKENWFKVEVPVSAENVIFNDGVGGEGRQTGDLAIDPNKTYYKEGAWISAFSVVTLRYFNSEGWLKVYAYVWSGTSPNDVKYFGDFPGAEMTAVDGHASWFEIEVNAEAEYVIFSDGVGGTLIVHQTPDLEIDPAKLYYMYQWIASYPEPEPLTVYYYNSNGWANVYAYAWKGAGEDPADKLLGTWHGTKMTAVDGHEGWFSIEVSASAQKICFNDGADAQTANYEIDPDALFCKDDYWTADYPAAWDGKLYVDLTGINWFNDGNADAYLYVWYADSTENGAWPGVKMTKISDRVYSAMIDTEKTFSGLKVVRCNPDLVDGNVQVWNESAEFNHIPGNHTIVITEL